MLERQARPAHKVLLERRGLRVLPVRRELELLARLVRKVLRGLPEQRELPEQLAQRASMD